MVGGGLARRVHELVEHVHEVFADYFGDSRSDCSCH